jgi:formylmethanofuran dehydrogenase subunit E
MLGLQKLGIDDAQPRNRKRLITFTEIDRCTDALRSDWLPAEQTTLKFRDWGKVAATFVDMQTEQAIRMAKSRRLARTLHQKSLTKNSPDAGVSRNVRRRPVHRNG